MPASDTMSGARDLILNLLETKHIAYHIHDSGLIGIFGDDLSWSKYLLVDADNDYLKIKIENYRWYKTSKYNIEKVVSLQERISDFNFDSLCKIVYEFDDDDNIVLTTVAHLEFSKDIPDLYSHLCLYLESIIQSHKILTKEEHNEMILNDASFNEEEGDEE